MNSDARICRLEKAPCKAMTLAEVIVAMLIISLFATSAISLTLFNQRRTLVNFYRLEAYRLALSVAEHAMEVPLANFNATYLMATNDPASATQWQWTGTENAMLHSSSMDKTLSSFTYPTTAYPMTFTKNIAPPASSAASLGSAQELDITITWSLSGRSYSIVVPVVRGA